MFRWLTDQYPDILNRQWVERNGLTTLPDIDCLYLDMNGIIHPCTHGNTNDALVVLDETAMLKKIVLYVDRLYKLVQPTQLLYLAVDGVAPRAKMNQQRSRRFRSAKEMELLESELVARSNSVKNEKNHGAEWKDGAQRFDSNCITPGTDFMLKLGLALQKWVAYKMETDPFWQNGATVIVSGPDVPGEGEHKVMEYLRQAQNLHSHSNTKKKNVDGDVDPANYGIYQRNQTHVLYGLDADLIMLGLVTHEPKFLLLREKMSVVMAGRNKNKYRKAKDMLEYDAHDFEILELQSLRQMLALQFRRFADVLPSFNLERIIDDFVFMCFAVGNDFLPHAPHLEIDGGALQLMMSTYIDLLEEWQGYLTKKERIHPQRLEEFLYRLAIYEEEHFKRRGYEENEPGWKLSADAELDDDLDFYGAFYSGAPTPPCAVPANQHGTKNVEPPPPPEDRPMAPTGNRSFRRQHPNDLSRSYRDFYYHTKLGWPVQDRSRTLFRRRQHVRHYIEGLHWNLNYYHNGCPAWDWYFPYLYAPLVTDMVNLHEFYQNNIDEEGFGTFDFELGTPLDSLAQLLSVLPPQSAALLPEPLGRLMLHPSSPLTSYYPSEFVSDANGKRQSWEAVVQIPFLDADTLRTTMQQVLEQQPSVLTPAEQRRNRRGTVHVFRPPATSSSESTSSSSSSSTEILDQRLETSTTPRSPRDRATRTSTTTMNNNTPGNTTTNARAIPNSNTKPRQPPRAPKETKNLQKSKPTTAE